MTTGIYTITNILNNKIYIGFSINIDKRFGEHQRALLHDAHHCIYLQNAVKKYGINNFKFETLIECEEQFLCSEEHYWCNLLNTHNSKFGYNDRPTDPNGNPRHSLSARLNMSKAQKGRIVSKEAVIKCQQTRKANAIINGYYHAPDSKCWEYNNKSKPVSSKMLPAMLQKCSRKVNQFTKTGTLIKEWPSMNDAERTLLNKLTGKICLCCNGKRPSAYNYIWRFIEDSFDKYAYISRGNKVGSIHKKGYTYTGEIYIKK